jgi:hypothetical protein
MATSHGHGGHGKAELPPLEDANQPTPAQHAALKNIVKTNAERLVGRDRAFVLRAINDILRDTNVQQQIGMLTSKIQQGILNELERLGAERRKAQSRGRTP